MFVAYFEGVVPTVTGQSAAECVYELKNGARVLGNPDAFYPIGKYIVREIVLEERMPKDSKPTQINIRAVPKSSAKLEIVLTENRSLSH